MGERERRSVMEREERNRRTKREREKWGERKRGRQRGCRDRGK